MSSRIDRGHRLSTMRESASSSQITPIHNVQTNTGDNLTELQSGTSIFEEDEQCPESPIRHIPVKNSKYKGVWQRSLTKLRPLSLFSNLSRNIKLFGTGLGEDEKTDV